MIEETGLVIGGVRHTTLFIGCSGQGYPGRRMIDPKFGISQPSYRQFLCLIRLSGSAINEIHIRTTSRGHFVWYVLG
jgi:hypothetical protein